MILNRLNNKMQLFTLQLVGWSVIIGISIFCSISVGSDSLDTFGLMRLSINLATLLLIYALNHLIFIPRYLFAERKRYYFLCNFILVMLLLAFSYWLKRSDILEQFKTNLPPVRPNPSITFLISDLINYILMVGLVTAIHLSERLQQSEEALKEAESARVKAELANLRSQINPHFLLNTLNNIYALTAIDTEKAQSTIKELSGLLRYILYDNLEERVALSKEVEFLKSYIELMSIRLPRKVQLTTEFMISEHSTTEISPLIFISLIENAFKHSVGANGEGFIDIHFIENIENSEVRLSINNSNYAKQEQDKSGHGIGLQQVKRRLELLYHNRYEWTIEANENTYSSCLTINVSFG